MKIIISRSTQVFVVQDLMQAKKEVCYVQRMIPYTVPDQAKQLPTPLKDQTTYLESSYHLVEEITRVKKSNGEYFFRICRSSFDAHEDQTSEPLCQIKEDVPGQLEDYLHTAGDRNLKREILALYF